jgi:hypothetical protein
VPGSSVPGFELERLAVEDGRVRVAGWWYGVRGRRFSRPSLTAIGGGSRARALADLEHKPWSAEDDQRWLAEFVWEHPLGDVEAFELAVAPDLAVRIPLPAALVPAKTGTDPPERSGEDIVEPLDGRPADGMADRVGLVTSAHRSPADGDVLSPAPAPITRTEGQRARALAARDAAIGERARLIEAHDRAVAERERLREELGEALAGSASAAADRDQAVTENRRLADERDRALRERDAAVALSERAGAERDALSDQRRAWQSEREGLIETRGQARAERNGLLAQYAQQRLVHERLTRERDEAVALGEQVAAERDRLRAQRDAAAAERDTTTHELQQVRRERGTALADAQRLSNGREQTHDAHHAALLTAERAVAAASDLERAKAALAVELNDTKLSAERLVRERDAAIAKLVSPARSRPAVPDERHPDAQPQTLPDGAINSAPTRPRDAKGHPQRTPPPRSFVATPQLSLSQSLLSRVVALTAVVAVVVIMIAIVLWR